MGAINCLIIFIIYLFYLLFLRFSTVLETTLNMWITQNDPEPSCIPSVTYLLLCSTEGRNSYRQFFSFFGELYPSEKVGYVLCVKYKCNLTFVMLSWPTASVAFAIHKSARVASWDSIVFIGCTFQNLIRQRSSGFAYILVYEYYEFW